MPDLRPYGRREKIPPMTSSPERVSDLSRSGGVPWPSASSRRKIRGRGFGSILIVEDNAADAGMISELLETSRVSAEIATTVSAAEASLFRHEYEVVLLDLGLPDASGAIAARRVLEAARGTPVVVLTGLSDDQVARECMELGAQDFLKKDELAETSLRKAIAHARSRSRAEDLRAKLEHSNRLAAIGQVAAGLAHEVSNPATLVLANLYLALEGIEGLRSSVRGSESSDLDNLERSVRDGLLGIERIMATVEDLRVFSHRDLGGFESIDVNEVCRASCRLLASRLRQVGVRQDLGDVSRVHGKGRRLAQVLLNLLTNALEALEHQGTRGICIRTGMRDGQIVIEVEDEGSGIPEELLGRIFEPFFTTKGPDRGAGLGLSISAEIVEELGGEIRVESQVGEGTRFTVTLPAAHGEHASGPDRGRHG
ncbi:MAG: response regulator [Deltaproteobacteria bacterium]|nr:response regulator [Deltaproteobacteria bacterium]